MPFDGNTYGKISLIAPMEYHPEAPSTAGVVSKSLAGAYAYSRTSSARKIGDQTFRIFGRDERIYGAYNLASTTTWVEIAEFNTRYIPNHATHALARVDMHVHGVSGVSVANLRIVVVSTATDTGSATQLSVDTSNPGVVFGNTGLGTTPIQIEAEVALATITKAAQAVVRVQGYVTDDGGSGGRGFSVAYAVAWWECRA